MRSISILLLTAVLASCSAVPPPPARTADAQRTLDTLLAGKVAQRPMNCLPNYRAEDMVRIDDSTLAFRESGARVYVAHMRGPCAGLSDPMNVLVTHESVGDGPCDGDLARVVDSSARMPIGACAWGEFVPYVRPRV